MAMDTAQISLWFASISVVISLLSAFFAFRQARAAEAQLRRKAPVFELVFSDQARADRWTEGHIIVRNLEAVGCLIEEIRVRGWGIRLLPDHDSFTTDTDGVRVMRNELPVEKASKRIILNQRLGVNKGPSLGGGIVQIRFAYKGPLTRKRFRYKWKWADE